MCPICMVLSEFRTPWPFGAVLCVLHVFGSFQVVHDDWGRARETRETDGRSCWERQDTRRVSTRNTACFIIK
ncbi:hypothetical protein LINPERHAP1_LOCUS27451, partial [Linum perenne]